MMKLKHKICNFWNFNDKLNTEIDRQHKNCEVSGSHGSEYEDGYHLGCCAV
jgi:hypothetical protein